MASLAHGQPSWHRIDEALGRTVLGISIATTLYPWSLSSIDQFVMAHGRSGVARVLVQPVKRARKKQVAQSRFAFVRSLSM